VSLSKEEQELFNKTIDIYAKQAEQASDEAQYWFKRCLKLSNEFSKIIRNETWKWLWQLASVFMLGMVMADIHDYPYWWLILFWVFWCISWINLSFWKKWFSKVKTFFNKLTKR
jgi:hypothetical protein